MEKVVLGLSASKREIFTTKKFNVVKQENYWTSEKQNSQILIQTIIFRILQIYINYLLPFSYGIAQMRLNTIRKIIRLRMQVFDEARANQI